MTVFLFFNYVQLFTKLTALIYTFYLRFDSTYHLCQTFVL